MIVSFLASLRYSANKYTHDFVGYENYVSPLY